VKFPFEKSCIFELSKQLSQWIILLLKNQNITCIFPRYSRYSRYKDTILQTQKCVHHSKWRVWFQSFEEVKCDAKQQATNVPR